MRMLTFGSLFAGIGGFDLGLKRAGLVCKWQVEKDPFCRQILTKHFPGVQQYGTVEAVGGANLQYVDAIVGGFPCQDLSVAGKQAGIEGSRSGLWFEFARIVGELRPRFVVVENVSGLLVYGAMRRVIGELSKLGYVGIWRVLRASDFGASHKRKRVFIVAVNMADSESGGWGVMREPSGSDGQLDGRSEALADSNRRQCEQSGRQEPNGRYDIRDGFSGSNGCGSIVGHSASSRYAGSEVGTTDKRHAREDGSGSSQSKRGGIDLVPNSMRKGCKRNEQEEPQKTGEQQKRATTELCQTPLGGSDEFGQFAPGPIDPRWRNIIQRSPDRSPSLESPIRGVADGLPDWVHRAMMNRTKRLSRLGNSIVPQIAEWIGRRLVEFDEQVRKENQHAVRHSRDGFGPPGTH